MQKVALLYNNLAIKGGAGNVTIWLAATLAARGFDTVVFADNFNPAPWPQELLSKFSIHILPDFSKRFLIGRSTLLKRRMFGRYLSRALSAFDIIVPINSPAIQWVWIAKKQKEDLGKVLWLCHEPTRQIFGAVTDRHFFDCEKYGNGNGFNKHLSEALTQHQSKMQRRAKRYSRKARWEIDASSVASTIIANSRFSAENIEKVFSRRAKVIYPGVLQLGNGRETRGTRRNYIGYVGRLSVRKNVHNVIEAFRILCERDGFDNLHLEIVGTGEKESELRKLVLDYGLNSRVTFLGQLTDEKLSEFYSSARLIVYVPIDEPFGLVPLESLYHCTPVIISNHGGPAEVLTHGENAYSVSPFNPKEIADAAAHCLLNEGKSRGLAEKGRALVQSSFTLDNFVDQLEGLFSAKRAGD